MTRAFKIGLMICAISLLSTHGMAAGTFGPNPDTKPSVFTYAFAGMGVGTMAGLSVGYLVIRNDGYNDGEWRPLVMASG